MKKVLLFILPLALVLFSCHKDTPNIFLQGNGQSNTQDQSKPALSISKTEIEINKSSDAFEYTLNISAPEDSSWEISGVPDWLSIDPMNGKGSTTMTIMGDGNKNDEPRTAEIDVVTSANSVKVKVTQEAKGAGDQDSQDKPTLTIFKTEIDLDKPSDAFESTLNISAPKDSSWEVIDVPSWLTVTPTQGMGNAKLTISAEKNGKPEARIGSFKIASSFDTITVNVSQDATIKDNISTNELLFDYNESSAKPVNITTGGNWEFGDLPDWITIAPKNGSGSSTVEITVDENYDASNRSGEIDLNINGVDTVLTINQEGNTALDITKDITTKQDGKYLNISGTNDFMEIAYSATSNSLFNIPSGSNYSVSMKIRIPESPVTAGLPGYLFGTLARDFNIVIFPGYGVTQNVFGTFSSHAGLKYGSTSIGLGDGKWHSVVLVIENAASPKIYLYIDGVKDAEQTLNGTDISATTSIVLGSLNDAGAPNHVKADIDDLHFWKTALTKKEVYGDAANIALPDIQGNLIAGWDFESASGNIVKDTVGSIEAELKNGATLDQN